MALIDKKFNFSEDFYKFIFQKSIGYITPSQVEELVHLLEVEAQKNNFTATSEANLIRIFTNLYDRSLFFRELIKYPHHSEIICAIAANSYYLVDIIIGNPEFLNYLFNPSIFFKKYTMEDYEEEIRLGFNAYKAFGAKINFLRLYKRRNLLRIGLADILGIFEMKEITKQLSFLASSISSVLLNLCLKEKIRKYGINELKGKYALVSLGKLGGNELNYSSDIDFICIYDKNYTVKESGKEYHEHLSEALQLFSKLAMEISPKGFMYRVDFRLRPDGKHSPMCRTILDTMNYYEIRGADWEKQMLLKAGFAGGDKNLFNNFKNFLEKYCFKHRSSESIIQQVSRMKRAIEERNKSDQNIKLSIGGIRDIEFSIQALQLLNGVKIKGLFTGNSLTAINLLAKHKILSTDEAKTYEEAYIFFRNIEHYLQLMNDRQTHIIPTKGEIPEKLAKYLKFKNEEEFWNFLEETKNNVRKIYNSIINIEENQTHDRLEGIKFLDKKNSIRDYNYLKTGLSIFNQKEFDQITVEAFEKIEEFLIYELKESNFPDTILINFVKVIKALKFPSILYKEFNNQKFFKAFIKNCEYNELGINEISNQPQISESFLNRKAIIPVSLENLAFKNNAEARLCLSSQFILSEITAQELSEKLSYSTASFIESKLKNQSVDFNFFIAGMGSFGSLNMTFTSDLDIIFIVEEFTNQEKTQKYFQSLFNQIKDEMRGFEIDCRLRPEGNNSQLVWDMNAYSNYFESRAQLWEFMALSKIRYISGSKKLYNDFLKLIEQKFLSFDYEKSLGEIFQMYSKVISQSSPFANSFINIKSSRGGITDIDFLSQMLLIKDKNIRMMFGKTQSEKLKYFGERFPKFSKDLTKLISNYEKLKTYQVASQSLSNMKNPKISRDLERLTKMSQFFGKKPIDIRDEILLLLRQNSDIFKKIKYSLQEEINY